MLLKGFSYHSRSEWPPSAPRNLKRKRMTEDSLAFCTTSKKKISPKKLFSEDGDSSGDDARANLALPLKPLSPKEGCWGDWRAKHRARAVLTIARDAHEAISALPQSIRAEFIKTSRCVVEGLHGDGVAYNVWASRHMSAIVKGNKLLLFVTWAITSQMPS